MQRIIIFLVALLVFFPSHAQVKKETSPDSIPKDSVVHYDKKKDSTARDSLTVEEIKKRSKKSKFTERIVDLLFKDRDKENSSGKTDHPPTSGFEDETDKIIREVKIKSRDPFGYSLKDPDKEPHNWAQNLGNTIHIKTKNMAVRKFFLFEKGEKVDTVLLNETARLLREQNYVRDVRIVPKEVEGSKDSIDVEVQLLDSWSLIPRLDFGGTKSKFGVVERNFIGTGHRLEFRSGKRFTDGNSAIDAAYTIPNINNSFIDFTINYQADFDHLYDRYVSVERDFYSPLTRWAGGAFLQERSMINPLPDSDMEFEDQLLRIRYQNFWGGYAFRLKGSLSQDWSTNLVVGLRGMLLNYRESPDKEYDPEDFYADERFLLGNIGIVSREFVQDRYVFRDGETEDVPVGTIYSFTTGIQRKNQKNRLYMGISGGYGNYFDWGMLSANFEAGSYHSSSKPEEAVISFKVNYFSKLWDIGKSWKLRQFIKPQMVIGINRKNTIVDRLGLNDEPYFKGVHNFEYVDYGRERRYIDYKNGNISGFESYAAGERKYVIDLQTQMYSPWELLGFRLNPVLNMSLAYLSGKNQTYGSNRFYSSIGIGFIIRNDYLVFDSFQLSFTYFPSMPGEGNHVLRGNGFRTEDFGFQSFRFGEPRPVSFE